MIPVIYNLVANCQMPMRFKICDPSKAWRNLGCLTNYNLNLLYKGKTRKEIIKPKDYYQLKIKPPKNPLPKLVPFTHEKGKAR